MSNTAPNNIADPTLLEAVADKAKRAYAGLLGGAGLIQAILASLMAWMADWKIAAMIAAAGTLVTLAVVGAFAGKNRSTLRNAAGASRTFWGSVIVLWILGALLGAFWSKLAWYGVMVLLAIAGIVAAYMVYSSTRPASTAKGNAQF